MERKPEHIDEIFKNRLYDAAPPPPAFVWDNVERELRKRKRRFLFWLFPIGLAATGLIGWLWMQKNAASAAFVQPSDAIEHQSIQSTGALAQVEYAKEPTSNTAQAKMPVKETVPAFTETPRIANPKGVYGQNSVNVAALPFAKKAKPANNTSDPDQETIVQIPDAIPQETFWGKGTAVSTNFSSSLLPAIKSGNAFCYRLNQVKNEDLVKKTWPKDVASPVFKSRAKKPVRHCYDFTKQPQAWLIEAYVGPSLAQGEMVTTPDNRPYLNERLSTEKRDVAFNAGLRASLMMRGNFLLRTGLQYDQMTEVFEYIDPDFVVYHVNHYTNSNGQVVWDTVGVDYGEKYLKTYNRFGMLDIPVNVGVELRKGRSGFNINAGMSFNILFWKRGAIVSPATDEPAWFTPNKHDLTVFKKRTGMSATASVQWFYHINPRMRVFIEPYFKKILNPVTVSQHPVEQRYGIVGLRFGATRILD